jgi:hypothetical protein
MDTHAVFNKKLIDFMNDLLLLKSGNKINVPQLDIALPAIMMAASIDPTQPRMMFHDHVVSKYGDHIRRRDEEFFLNESYEDAPVPGDLNIVNMLKGDWCALSPNNKSAIWQHLQVLLVLDDRIVAESDK